jgi:predicted nucleic acid-binding protein
VRSIGLPSFISAFVESTRLRNRALALALQCGRPVHDCFYAACAEAASATLVTADETFLHALRAEGVAIRGVPLARIHELAAA